MRQAIVTGATGGIGQAITHALRDAGYRVLAVGRDPGALARLAQEAGVVPVAADVTDTEALTQALAAASGGGAIDVLVNNAGMMPPLGNFCDLPEAEIDRALAVNLRSVMMLTRRIAPAMRDAGRGHIFFTGSTAGHAPFQNLAVYCATKAAVSGFAQSLRLDLAPAGVRVTEIVAGRVETGLYRDLLPDAARAAMYANRSAVQPQDVAAMVMAVLGLPAHVDVSRFDILPTHQATATGGADKEKRT